ncbi:MAG: flagellar biosynthesis anti-sigma factor FlgM [Nitrospira sp.]|nr:flagellar biosynthesis anti-sigma factor FlgM [Nitrospira sp.]HBP89572.1 hypothetical protein [Nitrospiraceae bacterium]HNP30789.1 flagellar biosynthesis anti-sigma factor FlgM [Nitrospirales bacterium]
MNPLSSHPATPPEDAPSSPHTKTVSSSHDAVKDISALPFNPVKDGRQSRSTPSQTISDCVERMSQIPDVREVRIAHIQKAIELQTYAISPEKLADSLIQELHPHPPETRPPTTS